MTCTPTTTGCTGVTQADGWGDTYTDCNSLGTYTETTADEAATAYVDGHNADLEISGPVGCAGAATFDSWSVQADIPGSGTIYVTWAYLGPLAGRTAESTSAIPFPTSADGFWD
jgi:hypothetical protein